MQLREEKANLSKQEKFLLEWSKQVGYYRAALKVELTWYMCLEKAVFRNES